MSSRWRAPLINMKCSLSFSTNLAVLSACVLLGVFIFFFFFESLQYPLQIWYNGHKSLNPAFVMESFLLWLQIVSLPIGLGGISDHELCLSRPFWIFFLFLLRNCYSHALAFLCDLFAAPFNTLSLSCIVSVLITLWCWKFLLWPCLFSSMSR